MATQRTRLECKDSTSDKFWEISVQGAKQTITFGRTGTKGQTKTKAFSSAALARSDAQKLIASKKKKGYTLPEQTDRTAGSVDPENRGPLLAKQDLLQALRTESTSGLLKKYSRTHRGGFKSFKISVFKKKIGRLAEHTPLLDVLSKTPDPTGEEAHLELQGDYLDFRHYFEASIIAPCLPPIKPGDATRKKTLKVERVQFFPGDVHLDTLRMEDDGYLIVLGSLFIKKRLTFESFDFRAGLLVFGNLHVQGDFVSRHGERVFVHGNVTVDGIMNSGSHNLFAGDLNVGLMLCGENGSSYIEGNFHAGILLPHDQHYLHVSGKAVANIALNMEASFTKPIVKSTPRAKLLPALDKALNWKKLGMNRKTFVEDYSLDDFEDELGFEEWLDELRTSLEDRFSRGKKSGKDAFLKGFPGPAVGRDKSPSPKKAAGAKVFEPTVHRVTGTASRKILKLLESGKPAAQIRAPIEKLLKLNTRLPAWLILDDAAYDEVLVHIASPMFFAHTSDEDVFYGQTENENVLKGSMVHSYDGEGEPVSEQPLTKYKAPLKTITSADFHSSIILFGLTWLEALPREKRPFLDLMRTADAAIGGDLEYFEHPATGPTKVDTTSPTDPVHHFAGGHGRCAAFHAGPLKKPSVKWSVEEKGYHERFGQPVAIGENIFSATRSGEPYFGAVDIKGKRLWEVQMSSSIAGPSGNAAGKGSLVLQATDHGMYAMDVKTGERIWHVPLSGLANSSPLIAGDIVYISRHRCLEARDINTGAKIWTTKPNKRGTFKDPFPVIRDGVVCFRDQDRLRAVDAATGQKEIWSRSYDTVQHLLTEDLLICAMRFGSLLAVDPRTGKKIYQCTPLPKDADGIHAMAYADGILIIKNTYLGNLYALDAKTGKIKWKRVSNKKNSGDGNPVIGGGLVYLVHQPDARKDFSQPDPYLLALDLKTGRQVWRLDSFMRQRRTYYPHSNATPLIHRGLLIIKAGGQDSVLFVLK